jgi:hypothetical protein
MTEIKCITFKTHQTIIAELVDEGNVEIKVKNPMQVIAVPPRSANDPGGVGFAPYLAFVEEFDEGIVISNDDILTVNTPVSDLLEQYRRMFSRIELAPAGLKV